MEAKKKLGRRILFPLMIFGLFGQMAWVIENMYLNVFMYKTVTYNLTATAWMVALSAIVATLATLFAGVLSDKVGKRKVFVSWGYVIWGFSVMIFALISTKNTENLFPNADSIKLTVAFIIIMDCIMSLIGSAANDSAFNAWVTDVTNSKNRGKAEGILAAMPLIAMLIVFGGFDGLTQKGQWQIFFVTLGGITTLGGIIGLILLKDSPSLKPKKGEYGKELIKGFQLSTIKANKNLYIVFLAMGILGIANNTFMPYIMVYIEYYLGITNYALLLGVIIIIASIFSVAIGYLIDKIDKRKFLLPALGAYLIGGVCMFLAKGIIFAGIAGILLMGANMLVSMLLAAIIRNLTPASKTGMFQGIRMVFFVLLPMCIGPFIGSFVSKTSKATYIDPLTDAAQPIPSNYIFLAAAIIALFLIIPFVSMLKMKKEDMNINDETKSNQE